MIKTSIGGAVWSPIYQRAYFATVPCCFFLHPGPAMTDISQRIPPELLTEILEYVSGRDLSNLAQVKRQLFVSGRIG